MPTWEDVNNPPEPVLIDVSRCCTPAPTAGNPIDSFYETISHTLTLGDPASLQASPTLGRLLVLGLVTGTEAYFRGILIGLTSICPIVKNTIADLQIALGAVDFYGRDNLALGLFERVSFASASEIKSKTKSITGITWNDNSSLGAAVNAFEQVCHIRHAAVHSHGVLNRGNVRALGLATTSVTLHVTVDLPHLHLAAKACTSLVKAYNSFLYKEILLRWLNAGLLTGTWERDKHLFKPLFELFRSTSDAIALKTPYAAYRTFLPRVLGRLSAGQPRL